MANNTRHFYSCHPHTCCVDLSKWFAGIDPIDLQGSHVNAPVEGSFNGFAAQKFQYDNKSYHMGYAMANNSGGLYFWNTYGKNDFSFPLGDVYNKGRFYPTPFDTIEPVLFDSGVWSSVDFFAEYNNSFWTTEYPHYGIGINNGKLYGWGNNLYGCVGQDKSVLPITVFPRAILNCSIEYVDNINLAKNENNNAIYLESFQPSKQSVTWSIIKSETDDPGEGADLSPKFWYFFDSFTANSLTINGEGHSPKDRFKLIPKVDDTINKKGLYVLENIVFNLTDISIVSQGTGYTSLDVVLNAQNGNVFVNCIISGTKLVGFNSIPTNVSYLDEVPEPILIGDGTDAEVKLSWTATFEYINVLNTPKYNSYNNINLFIKDTHNNQEYLFVDSVTLQDEIFGILDSWEIINGGTKYTSKYEKPLAVELTIDNAYRYGIYKVLLSPGNVESIKHPGPSGYLYAQYGSLLDTITTTYLSIPAISGNLMNITTDGSIIHSSEIEENIYKYVIKNVDKNLLVNFSSPGSRNDTWSATVGTNLGGTYSAFGATDGSGNFITKDCCAIVGLNTTSDFQLCGINFNNNVNVGYGKDIGEICQSIVNVNETNTVTSTLLGNFDNVSSLDPPLVETKFFGDWTEIDPELPSAGGVTVNTTTLLDPSYDLKEDFLFFLPPPQREPDLDIAYKIYSGGILELEYNYLGNGGDNDPIYLKFYIAKDDGGHREEPDIRATTNKIMPILIDGSSDWKAVVATKYRALALKQDGSLYHWGIKAGSCKPVVIKEKYTNNLDNISVGKKVYVNPPSWTFPQDFYTSFGDGMIYTKNTADYTRSNNQLAALVDNELINNFMPSLDRGSDTTCMCDNMYSDWKYNYTKYQYLHDKLRDGQTDIVLISKLNPFPQICAKNTTITKYRIYNGLSNTNIDKKISNIKIDNIFKFKNNLYLKQSNGTILRDRDNINDQLIVPVYEDNPTFEIYGFAGDANYDSVGTDLHKSVVFVPASFGDENDDAGSLFDVFLPGVFGSNSYYKGQKGEDPYGFPSEVWNLDIDWPAGFDGTNGHKITIDCPSNNQRTFDPVLNANGYFTSLGSYEYPLHQYQMEIINGGSGYGYQCGNFFQSFFMPSIGTVRQYVNFRFVPIDKPKDLIEQINVKYNEQTETYKLEGVRRWCRTMLKPSDGKMIYAYNGYPIYYRAGCNEARLWSGEGTIYYGGYRPNPQPLPPPKFYSLWASPDIRVTEPTTGFSAKAITVGQEVGFTLFTGRPKEGFSAFYTDCWRTGMPEYCWDELPEGELKYCYAIHGWEVEEWGTRDISYFVRDEKGIIIGSKEDLDSSSMIFTGTAWELTSVKDEPPEVQVFDPSPAGVSLLLYWMPMRFEWNTVSLSEQVSTSCSAGGHKFTYIELPQKLEVLDYHAVKSLIDIKWKISWVEDSLGRLRTLEKNLPVYDLYVAKPYPTYADLYTVDPESGAITDIKDVTLGNDGQFPLITDRIYKIEQYLITDTNFYGRNTRRSQLISDNATCKFSKKVQGIQEAGQIFVNNGSMEDFQKNVINKLGYLTSSTGVSIIGNQLVLESDNLLIDLNTNKLLSNINVKNLSKNGYHDGNFPGIPSIQVLSCPTVSRLNAIINGSISSIAIEDGGCGFYDSPNVHIKGLLAEGSGHQGNGLAIIEGPIDSIEILDPGRGYKFAPTIQFIGTGIFPIINNIILNEEGGILSIEIDKNATTHTGQCSKYRHLPSISLSNEEFLDIPNTRSAKLRAVLNGSVIYVNITDPGSYYQYPPDILIDMNNNYNHNIYYKLMNGEITRKNYDDNLQTPIAQAQITGLLNKIIAEKNAGNENFSYKTENVRSAIGGRNNVIALPTPDNSANKIIITDIPISTISDMIVNNIDIRDISYLLQDTSGQYSASKKLRNVKFTEAIVDGDNVIVTLNQSFSKQFYVTTDDGSFYSVDGNIIDIRLSYVSIGIDKPFIPVVIDESPINYRIPAITTNIPTKVSQPESTEDIITYCANKGSNKMLMPSVTLRNDMVASPNQTFYRSPTIRVKNGGISIIPKRLKNLRITGEFFQDINGRLSTTPNIKRKSNAYDEYHVYKLNNIIVDNNQLNNINININNNIVSLSGIIWENNPIFNIYDVLGSGIVLTTELNTPSGTILNVSGSGNGNYTESSIIQIDSGDLYTMTPNIIGTIVNSKISEINLTNAGYCYNILDNIIIEIDHNTGSGFAFGLIPSKDGMSIDKAYIISCGNNYSSFPNINISIKPTYNQSILNQINKSLRSNSLIQYDSFMIEYKYHGKYKTYNRRYLTDEVIQDISSIGSGFCYRHDGIAAVDIYQEADPTYNYNGNEKYTGYKDPPDIVVRAQLLTLPTVSPINNLGYNLGDKNLETEIIANQGIVIDSIGLLYDF